MAVPAQGESRHSGSKRFAGEAGRDASGNLRTVHFRPNPLKGPTARVCRPDA